MSQRKPGSAQRRLGGVGLRHPAPSPLGASMSVWIKMRTNLVDDPRVGKIALVCSTTEPTVLGALFILWSIADQHSTDGHLPFMSEDWLDGRVGLPGFSDALRGVGWLGTPESGSEGLLVPSFDEHNGASAKRRAMEASRKGRVRKSSASNADKVRNRAEQSRAYLLPCYARRVAARASARQRGVWAHSIA